MKRIHGDVENDIYFVGTSSEEVGVRGGKTATHLIDPDIVFALDVANNPELVKSILEDGTNHARKKATEVVKNVKRAMKIDY